VIEMTKAKMIEYIEKSQMVINFNKSHFMNRPKKYVERFYEMAINYNNNKMVKA
jgi:hypothetical protein